MTVSSGPSPGTVNLIVLAVVGVLGLAAVARLAGMSGSSFAPPGPGHAYVDECKNVLTKKSMFSLFRVSLVQTGQGELYHMGEPNKTTGYYTSFVMTAGRLENVPVTCYATINGTLDHVYLHTDSGPMCLARDGNDQDLYPWECK